ncbi:hypothetical protein [Gulosibacter molinativorax]|uniref:Uncharacterized protein n=1 Tax=Gulosibacter molinativorax TaxID=256821 RepID=A0ABT7CC48_9MICO|nr:hypothetical protein [Gulosibacter molinativorax]MDJ1372768.1 hypothetical protein [Gulosibacter molinativorax]QUY63362.1 Hypotetical protein [Gulosibacter molinativorax]
MLRALRYWFYDPPQWRPVVLLGYVVAFAMGMVTLIAPPLTIAGQLGHVLTTIWACLLIAGSLLAACTVYSDWWWLERLGIKIAALGLGVYLGVVVYLWGFEAGNRGTQFFGLTLGLCFFLLRFLQIQAWDYRPRRLDRED